MGGGMLGDVYALPLVSRFLPVRLLEVTPTGTESLWTLGGEAFLCFDLSHSLSGNHIPFSYRFFLFFPAEFPRRE